MQRTTGNSHRAGAGLQQLPIRPYLCTSSAFFPSWFSFTSSRNNLNSSTFHDENFFLRKTLLQGLRLLWPQCLFHKLAKDFGNNYVDGEGNHRGRTTPTTAKYSLHVAETTHQLWPRKKRTPILSFARFRMLAHLSKNDVMWRKWKLPIVRYHAQYMCVFSEHIHHECIGACITCTM